jgi:hypothetical protein
MRVLRRHVAALLAAIVVLTARCIPKRDARDKRGHDGEQRQTAFG